MLQRRVKVLLKQYDYEYTEEESADGTVVSVRRRRKLRTVNFGDEFMTHDMVGVRIEE